ncbi:hypothetical protein [Devosia sp. SD17-2]|jgi:hypothetical protein|uniref:hypothetical protein n=1 Tax=Devosia sp. SD17-2 TaxID=2976459 RepID=UPI0023D81FC5|nr:hypothetical protein [Devosia sp. SD17-2]WEJ32741.1 hypothetical protein NYQ88_17950 [Devosia sp. SD17-2]
MTRAADLYYADVGPGDLEDLVHYERVEVYVVAETARGYFVNDKPGRAGSRFIDQKFVGSMSGPYGDGGMTVKIEYAWLKENGKLHWIDRDELYDYEPITPREPAVSIECGPDEEPF